MGQAAGRRLVCLWGPHRCVCCSFFSLLFSQDKKNTAKKFFEREQGTLVSTTGTFLVAWRKTFIKRLVCRDWGIRNDSNFCKADGSMVELKRNQLGSSSKLVWLSRAWVARNKGKLQAGSKENWYSEGKFYFGGPSGWECGSLVLFRAVFHLPHYISDRSNCPSWL